MRGKLQRGFSAILLLIILLVVFAAVGYWWWKGRTTTKPLGSQIYQQVQNSLKKR